MGFHYPRGGTGAQGSGLEELLGHLVEEIRLMRIAMEEMGCFVGIDCPDDPVPPDPTIPPCTLYAGESPVVTSTGAFITLSVCSSSEIPDTALFTSGGEVLVSSTGDYIVGG